MTDAKSVRSLQDITPALIEEFDRQGAVCLRGLLSADEVALLRQGIGFYPALALNCALTALLYFGMVRFGGAVGLKL